MSRLNYHHLQYFHEVARQKSVSKAARALNVSQPTVSAQLKALETMLGDELFIRTGRDLVMTELGRTVFEYAGEIFLLGRELEEAVTTHKSGRPIRLRVGVADCMPKLAAHVLIRPALAVNQQFQLLVQVDRHDRLIDELSSHRLDVVLAHAPSPAFRGATFPLGESGVSFMAAGDLPRKLTGGFPKNLHDAPMYLPMLQSPLRGLLDDWFAQSGVRPQVMGEFSDSASIETFGQGGTAVFPALTLIERQVVQQYRARVVGRTEQVRERFFAIASSKRLTHPGVAAICKQPRLLAELVDGMPVTDIGMLKRIAKRLRAKRPRVK